MPQVTLASRLQALIFFRVFFVTLLLGSSFLFGSGFFSVTRPESLSAFIVSLYSVSIIYGFLFKKYGDNITFAYVQLLGDVLAEAVLVFISGGVISWFPFTFLLSILSASVILPGLASYLVAALASVVYGGILALQAAGLVLAQSTPELASADYLYKAFVHFLAFFSVAFLSSQLANRLRIVSEDLEKTDFDYSDLKAFSRDVIEFIPVGLITSDASGRILTSNPAARRILGHLDTPVVGRQLTEIFPFASLDHTYDERLDGEIERPGEKNLVVGLSMAPLKNRSGAAVGHIVIFRDLTAIREMELEMQKRKQLAAVGELSAWIAHELRTPLASIKSSVEMLREEKEPTRYSYQLMDIAIREMDRLNRIVTDFLTYARPKAPDKREFDLVNLVRETVLVFRQRENIKVYENLCESLKIIGDPDQLKQVLLNLLLNAEQAMPEGGDIRVRVLGRDGRAEVSIADTGPGIPSEQMDKIFYPYYSTKEKGTGLGLAVAYRIVEEHAGTLEVLSSAGKGAEFTLKVPIELN